MIDLMCFGGGRHTSTFYRISQLPGICGIEFLLAEEYWVILHSVEKMVLIHLVGFAKRRDNKMPGRVSTIFWCLKADPNCPTSTIQQPPNGNLYWHRYCRIKICFLPLRSVGFQGPFYKFLCPTWKAMLHFVTVFQIHMKDLQKFSSINRKFC